MAKENNKTSNESSGVKGILTTLVIMLLASGIFIANSIIMGLWSSAYNKMGIISLIVFLIVFVGYITSIVGFSKGRSWSRILAIIVSVIVTIYMIIEFVISNNGFSMLLAIVGIAVILYLLLNKKMKEAFN